MLSSKDFKPGQKVWIVHPQFDHSYSIEETEVVKVVHSIITVECNLSYHRVKGLFYEYRPTLVKYLIPTGSSVLFHTRESAVGYINGMSRGSETKGRSLEEITLDIAREVQKDFGFSDNTLLDLQYVIYDSILRQPEWHDQNWDYYLNEVIWSFTSRVKFVITVIDNGMKKYVTKAGSIMRSIKRANLYSKRNVALRILSSSEWRNVGNVEEIRLQRE